MVLSCDTHRLYAGGPTFGPQGFAGPAARSQQTNAAVYPRLAAPTPDHARQGRVVHEDDDESLLCSDLETLELVSRETFDSISSSHGPDRDPWVQLLRCARARHAKGKPLRKLCIQDSYAQDVRNLPRVIGKQLREYVEIVEVKRSFST